MHKAEGLITATQRVFFFGDGSCEGDPTRKDVLGGKGASLAAMSCAGLPVPPGFTITVGCCKQYHANGQRWPDGLEEEVRAQLARLESSTGRTFGKGRDPLLVSVRSGAAHSMPGMMDTILNCGLHADMESQVADKQRFWSVYAAFARQVATTVAHIAPEALEEAVKKAGAEDNPQAATQSHMRMFEAATGRPFPKAPWDALLECINAVFASWNNERARIYRKAHGLEHLEGTAVNVQAMFSSRVSGIAFTVNPSRPLDEQVIIESSYGLGESIVSGEVTPDRFIVDRGNMQIIERAIGHKDSVMCALDREEIDAPCGATDPSLTDAQINELAALALKVEDYFGHPVDIEWGLSHGRFSLLQSRAIRGLEVARDVESGRQEEVTRLKAIIAAEGRKSKVWIVHNLSETLEAPTPLTWDMISWFMSGDGGFGRMYKDFGYRPSERVCREGFLELICGRIYCDPDRACDLFWEGMPFEYDHDEILADPRILEAAPKKFQPDRADEKFLLRLPGTVLAMLRSSKLTKRARASAAEIFNNDILPPYLEYVRNGLAANLAAMPTTELLEELNDRTKLVLGHFAAESLKPGFFGGAARAELEELLKQLMGEQDGIMFCQTLTSGLSNDTTVEQNAMLFEVARGKATMDDFVIRYGHRAVSEMELSRPRWREDAGYLHQVVNSMSTAATHSPAALHKRNEDRRHEAMANLLPVLKQHGGSFLYEKIEKLAREAQELLPYREVGKHYLLMGLELLRNVLLELGRRWEIGDDVFFLKLEELPRFEADTGALVAAAGKRRVRWQSARKLDLPDVIDSREIDALGLPRQLKSSKEMTGLSLSSGVVTGTARIVLAPDQAGDLGDDCILICPSTDPSWTALFMTIKGLVVERGGVLSHGAITARDFSIPAVACPDTTHLIPDGARVRIDGNRGQITIIED